jgi:hypothetical protein
MANIGGSRPIAAGAAALVLALAPAPLAAQSVSDYRLPGSETPRPNVQGPVDADNPDLRGPAPRPSAAPAPVAAAPSPAPQSSASVDASPLPRTVQPAQPRPVPVTTRPASTLTPAIGPTATPALPPLLPSPDTLPSAFPTPQGDIAAMPAAPIDIAGSDWPWVWLAGGAAALLAALGALAALLLRRRRLAQDPAVEFEPPVVAQPKAALNPAPAALPEPMMSAALRPSGLGIALEARRMNASLMATTLSYNIKLTNHSDHHLSALAIEGDMIAAHASLPPERQIASSSDRLELRHALIALAPGESAEFTGDFRLPLTAITPIRSGNAAFFVPLARLRIEASTATGSPLIEAQTFVVGELPELPGAALRPFRLDLGPRNYARVGQRAVN